MTLYPEKEEQFFKIFGTENVQMDKAQPPLYGIQVGGCREKTGVKTTKSGLARLLQVYLLKQYSPPPPPTCNPDAYTFRVKIGLFEDLEDLYCCLLYVLRFRRYFGGKDTLF